MHMTNPHGLSPLHAFPNINGLNNAAAMNPMNGIGISSLPLMSSPLSKMTGSLMLPSANTGSMLGTPNSVMMSTGSKEHPLGHDVIEIHIVLQQMSPSVPIVSDLRACVDISENNPHAFQTAEILLLMGQWTIHQPTTAATPSLS